MQKFEDACPTCWIFNSCVYFTSLKLTTLMGAMAEGQITSRHTGRPKAETELALLTAENIIFIIFTIITWPTLLGTPRKCFWEYEQSNAPARKLSIFPLTVSEIN